MKKRWPLFLLPLLTLAGLVLAQEPPSSAFYSILWKNDKAWFRSPSGKPFFSLGINAIGDQSYRASNPLYYDPVKNQFGGNKGSWIRSVLSRLRKWNFNTIGCWADEDLLGKKFPYTYMLYIARGNPWDSVLDSVFSPEFEKRVQENARKAERFKDDPDLIGYFLDNEMPWWGEYGWKTDGQKNLLEKYALGAVENADKAALKKFFQERYHDDLDAFDKAWEIGLSSFEGLQGPVTLKTRTKAQRRDAEAWAGVVAERYFSVSTKALRAVDPNHLILGVRFAGESPWSVVEACGKYCDVVSVNLYSKSGKLDRTFLDNEYARSKRPLLLSEYSYSAMENQSGDPNRHGADVTVPTQRERAERFTHFARASLELPYLLGLHWFEWADESPQGRFDGEDQNYGLVDIHDREYILLTQAHSKLNSAAVGLHGKSAQPLPKEFTSLGEARVREAIEGLKVAPVRRFLRIDKSAHVDTWGDNGTGGKMIADTTSGVLVSEFETGTGWGCGESCFCNQEPLVAWGTADLRGYSFFEFKAFVPKGLRFSVFLSESGAAGPSQASYDGLQGADGESYQFPEFQGTGLWETYRLDLSDLERRSVWGNQKGNNILDLQALHDVQFYLPGNQGAGKILLKDLEFKVK